MYNPIEERSTHSPAPSVSTPPAIATNGVLYPDGAQELFSPRLLQKIAHYWPRAKAQSLGEIAVASPFLLAPMAAIGNAPFRLLMQALGAGAVVSELISADGLHYDNKKTRDMLRIHPLERRVGIQIFGTDREKLAAAAVKAHGAGADFVDLNLGCPVKKVVTKGGGAALLKEPEALGRIISHVVQRLEIPFTIKIRSGWDASVRNADEIIAIAQEKGANWVAIHGRTRQQAYRGLADWEHIESLARSTQLPLIGNGDLHTPAALRNRWAQTHCQALMVARGCLRNPFIFLEGLLAQGDEVPLEARFSGEDYLEIIKVLGHLYLELETPERIANIQMKKFMVWFAAGHPYASQFRSQIFENDSLSQAYDLATDFFLTHAQAPKEIDPNESFMTSGHG